MELELDCGQEVRGVVLVNREVGVPGDTEHVVLGDLHRREETLQMGSDHLFYRHETLRIGERDESRQQRRHLDPSDALLSGRRVDHPHQQIHAEIRDVRERVSRIDSQRGQDRKDHAIEDLAEQSSGCGIEPMPVRRRHPRVDQCRQDLLTEDVTLSFHQPCDAGDDGRELLGGAEPIGRAGPDSCRHLILEAGHTHLEELVETLGEDREKLGPFE